MLGHKLTQVLHPHHQVVGTIRSDRPHPFLERYQLETGVDCAHLDQIEAVVDRTKPDFLVNCVGLIKHRKPSRLDQLLINSVLPQRLAELGDARGYKLLQLSTDCVFSGKKGHYTEDDFADADDDYGRTKYLGEVDRPNALTLRTSIIGRELRGGLGLIEWLYSQRGKQIKGFRRAIYTGATTLALSRVVLRIINERPDLFGLWQVSSAPISKFRLLTDINRQASLNITIEADDDFVCDRSLDGSRFSRETGITLPEWPEMIADMIADCEAYQIAQR